MSMDEADFAMVQRELTALTNAIHPGETIIDSYNNQIDCVTEAIVGVTEGLSEIRHAIEELTAAVQAIAAQNKEG